MAAPAAGILTASGVPAAQTPSKPVNIIFMVSDGMSAGVLALAELASHAVRGHGTAWCELLKDRNAVIGLFDQASLNSCVTDSSAASSAWGSGVRINNGAVNMLPGGRKLTPIAAIAKERGKRVGLVTTTTITHATPAGFAAVSKTRMDEPGIAAQYSANVDVLMGGGIEFFDAELRRDGRDLLGEYHELGYTVLRNRTDLASASGNQRLLGLFGRGQLRYCIDRRNDAHSTIPPLTECMSTAIDALESENGFLLMVEGGRVDHAAHANDAAALIWEQFDFDDAVRAALEYARRRGDTLVVLCSDHGNANPGLNDVGGGPEGESDNFRKLAGAMGSFTAVSAALREESSAADVLNNFYEIEATPKECQAVADAAARSRGITLNKQYDTLNGVLGQCLANHFGVGWVGKGHTSDHTISTATGPGAEEFAGLIPNTQVFEILTGCMGSTFRNESMSDEEARKLISVESPSHLIHWV